MKNFEGKPVRAMSRKECPWPDRGEDCHFAPTFGRAEVPCLVYSDRETGEEVGRYVIGADVFIQWERGESHAVTEGIETLEETDTVRN